MASSLTVSLIISLTERVRGRDRAEFVGTAEYRTSLGRVEELEVRRALERYFGKNGFVGPRSRYAITALVPGDEEGTAFAAEVGDPRSDRLVDLRAIRL